MKIACSGVLTFRSGATVASPTPLWQIAGRPAATRSSTLWGWLAARYTPASGSGGRGHRRAFNREVAARPPVKPIAQLAVDHRGSAANFGAESEASPGSMTVYGL